MRRDNLCTFIGRLTAEPKGSVTKNGTQAARYSIAVRRCRNEPEAVDFFDCDVFGKSAEYALKTLKKGMKVAVYGEFRIDRYTDSNGEKRKRPHVLVTDGQEILSGAGTADRCRDDGQYTEPEPYQASEPAAYDMPAGEYYGEPLTYPYV